MIDRENFFDEPVGNYLIENIRNFQKLKWEFYIRLDLKNLFAVTQPTQLWRCRLKIFYWTSKSKKQIFLSQKTFPMVTHYFNLNFYSSNACLNSVHHIYCFPQQKIKRTDAWFQVSKRFVFSLSPYQIILTKRYSHFTLIWQ